MKNIFFILSIWFLGTLVFSSCEKEAIPPPSYDASYIATKAKISVTLAMHSAEGDCSTDIETLSFTEVYLYLTEEDRSNNTIYKQGKTGTNGDITFSQLEEGQYVVQATYEGQTAADIVRIHGNVRTAYLELRFDNGEN